MSSIAKRLERLLSGVLMVAGVFDVVAALSAQFITGAVDLWDIFVMIFGLVMIRVSRGMAE